MTNKRAIELLNRISDSQFDGPHGDERREALEMAVRALSGDGDTISRQQAIDAVVSAMIDGADAELVEGVMELLPPAQPQWIPCSERLPDYGVSVLTWDGYCYCVEKRIPYIRDEDGEPISSDWWVSDEYNECKSDYYPNLRDCACIAWMPLPKPYGGDNK